MTSRKPKQKPTPKDRRIVLLFIILVILNIVRHIVYSGFDSIGTMIEQTILLMLSFVGLIEISDLIGWNFFVPDFFIYEKKQKSKEEAQNYLREIFNEDINFIREYDQVRIDYLLSQLGISIEQLDQIRIDLITMRCIPLRDIEDAKKKLEYLAKCDYPIVIDQRKMDNSKLSYTKVDYFINLVDIMFVRQYARELASILSFLVKENANLPSIDNIIVPYDSNFLLGVEVGKRLGKPVVKVRKEDGRIETEKRWEGNLKTSDRVIIIHDVLVTAEQIIESTMLIPETCHIIGLYCLVVRKEWDGLVKLMHKGIPVHRIIDLDDNDIRILRGED